MAVLLAVAAWCHPIRRERRWLVPALLLSAAGDFFLAMPWWKPSFVLGLGAFLVAHLCYLGALLPYGGAVARAWRAQRWWSPRLWACWCGSGRGCWTRGWSYR